MFGIKTFIENNILYPEFLFPKDTNKFPEKPIPKIQVQARLFGVLNKLKRQREHSQVGNLLTFPRKEAISAWKALLPYNPNNLGNWSIERIKPVLETAKIERELIYKMIDLYHGERREIEGYVTSGGTEANIFSAWLGRKYLEKRGIGKDKICFIRTSLSHYSIEKAADIIGVPTFITPLSKKSWAIDVDSLDKTVDRLGKRGFRGFLLPLTLGYTLTGTVDPYKETCLRIRGLKRQIKEIDFFIWMDAALNGLVEPFLNEKFRPFAYPEIQAFLTDFHKFGFVPYPAGIILYRSNLRKYIERPIDYLAENDNTVLGSRSGISAVAIWAAIHSLGKRGYRDIIKHCQVCKEKFIKNMIKFYPETRIVSSDKSISGGIVLKSLGSRKLREFLERELSLHPANITIQFAKKRKKMTIYKFFFLDPKVDVESLIK